MAKPKHIEILKQGVEAWNKWREENPDEIPDLVDADLKGVSLCDEIIAQIPLDDPTLYWKNTSWMHHEGVFKRGVLNEKIVARGFNLAGARLCGAQLQGVWLSGANLSEADMRGADLHQATLAAVLMNRTDLRGAILNFADFHGAILNKADLRGAEIVGTKFIRTQLQSAKCHNVNGFTADFTGSAIDLANFTSAKLPKSNFSGSSLCRVTYDGANLSWANLSGTQVSGIKFDNEMQCRGIYAVNALGSQRFLRHVMDLDYIEETRENHPVKYFAWSYTSDCGRCWELLFVWCVFIIGLFAVFFDWVGAQRPLISSIMAFTSFGFVDTNAHSTGEFVLVCVEAMLGFTLFGCLISLVSSMMARRSG